MWLHKIYPGRILPTSHWRSPNRECQIIPSGSRIFLVDLWRHGWTHQIHLWTYMIIMYKSRYWMIWLRFSPRVLLRSVPLGSWNVPSGSSSMTISWNSIHGSVTSHFRSQFSQFLTPAVSNLLSNNVFHDFPRSNDVQFVDGKVISPSWQMANGKWWLWPLWIVNTIIV